jgi:hypothetical protein
METQLIRDLSGIHRIRQVLLVRENEEEGVTEFVLAEHALELFPGLGHTLPIAGINNEDDSLGVLEVWA